MAYGFNEDKTKASIEEIAASVGSDKVDKVAGKVLSDNDYTDADKAIVDGATTALSDKVDKVTGKGLSTNNFTSGYKSKIDEASYNTSTGSGTTLGLNGTNNYSLANPFTCPHDGYVQISTGESGGYVQLCILITSNTTINERITANQYTRSDQVFVKKGMKLYAVTSGSATTAFYRPLTSYT